MKALGAAELRRAPHYRAPPLEGSTDPASRLGTAFPGQRSAAGPAASRLPVLLLPAREDPALGGTLWKRLKLLEPRGFKWDRVLGHINLLASAWLGAASPLHLGTSPLPPPGHLSSRCPMWQPVPSSTGETEAQMREGCDMSRGELGDLAPITTWAALVQGQIWGCCPLPGLRRVQE